MSTREAIAIAAAREEVPGRVLEAAFDEIMQGKASEAQIAALLVALRTKGESVGEIVAAARALRAHACTAPLPDPRTVDTCGTGGSGRATFSISTTAAFVVAGAGVPVAKHGNRAASSRTGSFDTLEALGVRIDLPIAVCAEILARIGIAAFFARTAHPAFRHMAPVRAQIGVRTLLNCIGPLLNPVGALHQIVGVYDEALVEPMAVALGRLGARRALVVHGCDGLDELTTTGESLAVLLADGRVQRFEVEPSELGIAHADPADLAGGDAQANAAILRKILDGERGPRRDIVLLNAAGALWAAGAVTGLAAGLELAAKSIDSGAARARLEALVRATDAASSAEASAASAAEEEAG